MPPNETVAPQESGDPALPPAEPRRKKQRYIAGGLVLALLALVFVVASSDPDTVPADTVSNITVPDNSSFANPEPVTIEGYSGPQQDPVISPDGQYLFFDTHTDVDKPMHLYWAKRVDYKTFTFLGRVPGVEHEGIEGALDTEGNFYFISPPAFLPEGGTTMGRGVFANDTVTGIAPIRGVAPATAPAGTEILTFDMAITPDSKTLYFSEFVLKKGAGTGPRAIKGAKLSVATKNADGSFTRLPNADEILKNVNGLGALVYNATPSSDGLTLVFNAAPYFGPLPRMYIATRSSTSAAFGQPERVGAAEQIEQGTLSEPGSFSHDGTHLYFHRVLTERTSQLYVLTRQ